MRRVRSDFTLPSLLERRSGLLRFEIVNTSAQFLQSEILLHLLALIHPTSIETGAGSGVKII